MSEISKRLDALRLKAFRTNHECDRTEYFNALSKAFQNGDLVPAAHARAEAVGADVDKIMDAIVDECQKERLFLGTVNAREVIRRHIFSALSEKEARG